MHRPGRCWSSVDFDPFGPAEATAWLAARGVERDVSAPMTLAQLYEAADGRETVARERAAFGFARASSSAPAPDRQPVP